MTSRMPKLESFVVVFIRDGVEKSCGPFTFLADAEKARADIERWEGVAKAEVVKHGVEAANG